jgi:hypothetical protein
MTNDNPYELPAPSVVADLCAQRAWDDHVDDDTRVRLEFAADTIRLLMKRCVELAGLFERLEAEL